MAARHLGRGGEGEGTSLFEFEDARLIGSWEWGQTVDVSGGPLPFPGPFLGIPRSPVVLPGGRSRPFFGFLFCIFATRRVPSSPPPLDSSSFSRFA